MSYAVKVENLTKKYKIYGSPATKTSMLVNPFSKKKPNEFVALKDVSFEIGRGEIVGIIINQKRVDFCQSSTIHPLVLFRFSKKLGIV